MAWTPDDEELAVCWLATETLVRDGVLAFNPAARRGGSIPTNGRDFLDELNRHRLDIMRGGHCVDPTATPTLLATERGVPVESLFTRPEIEAAVADLRRIDALDAEAAASDTARLGGRIARGALAHTGRAVFESLLALVYVLPTAAAAIWAAGAYPRHAGELFALCGALFVASAVVLLRAALNPARAFRGAERSRGLAAHAGPSRRPVVHYVALDVAFLVGSFVAAAAAWEAYRPGTFVGAADAGIEEWFVYGLDNLVRTVGLDIAEVFRLRLSSIVHGSGWLPAAFVLSFRTLLSVLGVSLIVDAARRYRA